MSFRIGAAAAARMPFAAERKMADQIGPQPFSMQRCIHIDRRMHMQHLAARYRYAFRARATGKEKRREDADAYILRARARVYVRVRVFMCGVCRHALRRTR